MTRATADLLLLAAALIWGLAFVGQATAMEHMGPLTFSGARFLMAALVVAPFAFAESRRNLPVIPKKRLMQIVGIGVAFFLGVALQQTALLTTSVSNAGFLTALYVVMVPALAYVVTKFRTTSEADKQHAKLHAAIWPAAALSLIGTFLLGGGSIAGLNTGDWLIILGAFFWAIQILALGWIAYDLRRPMVISLIQFIVVAALGLAFGIYFEAPTWGGVGDAWMELLYTGIISGGLAFTLQSVAQAHTPASDAAIILSSEGLFAAAFGALLLGERLTLSGWTGAACVLAAVLIVQLGPLMRRR
ncbi:MAG: DMT family transporter [Parvibaculum sp.]|nr:DMT family transporter [Parvibaculum sp.]